MIKSSKGSCMSKSVFPAVAAAVALLAGAATSAGAAEAKNAVSKVAAKQLQDANKAMKAKSYAECIKKAQEALAAAGHTPFDAYVANQLLAPCYAGAGNNAEAAAALEAQ